MIPRCIHQLWIDPHAPPIYSSQRQRYREHEPPGDVQENAASWQHHHPGFTYKLWSLDEILSLASLSDHPAIRQIIADCRFPAMQSDLARLFLLEVLGGVWVDLKLFALKPFLDDFVALDLLVVEHFPQENLPEPNGFLINSLIGAKPYQPCISRALDTAMRNIIRRQPGSIFYVAGAPVLLEAIQSAKVSDKPLMLPHASTWDRLFAIRGGSYNGEGMHWSQRQEREPVYGR